jgi:hypothetical protein
MVSHQGVQKWHLKMKIEDGNGNGMRCEMRTEMK